MSERQEWSQPYWLRVAEVISGIATVAISAFVITNPGYGAHELVLLLSPALIFSAATLTATINQWNNDVAAGKGDTVFGRAASTMAAISTPPFYALPLWPEGPNVNGGPIRDEMARVCDPDYNPIPRLYSAGEFGSVFAEIYSGSNLGEVCAFGRIAGNNAAAETPWTS